ncbi:MAG: acetyl-CoA C-acetyltransferase [Clostridiales bacterium]|nr:acetyl-CoA C-acetyltransferase [Clostridiales bacterium]
MTYIYAYGRTPFGKFGGSLATVPAVELGAHVLRSLLGKTEVDPKAIDYVLMGMVVQAGAGQIPSRQASMGAGMPPEVPSDTINKVCASGLRAVYYGHLMIGAGEARLILAGGMESMSQAPYALPRARFGYRMGNGELLDLVIHDGLFCSFGQCHMGVYGSRVAKEFGITREAQDEWALRSHQRAWAAREAGRLAEEIFPVEVAGPKGGRTLVEHDEAIRPDTSLEKLAALKPAFEPDGTVTAGNAPGLSDGAAALLLGNEEVGKALGLKPLARIVATGQVSAEPPYLHTVPWLSAQQALQKAGLKVEDIHLWEINEAFAAVTLTSIKLGGIDPERVNVNGGAVALGHPIGASGARILGTLALELQKRGGGYGVAAICSGGGQGEAVIIRAEG